MPRMGLEKNVLLTKGHVSFFSVLFWKPNLMKQQHIFPGVTNHAFLISVTLHRMYPVVGIFRNADSLFGLLIPILVQLGDYRSFLNEFCQPKMHLAMAPQLFCSQIPLVQTPKYFILFTACSISEIMYSMSFSPTSLEDSCFQGLCLFFCSLFYPLGLLLCPGQECTVKICMLRKPWKRSSH